MGLIFALSLAAPPAEAARWEFAARFDASTDQLAVDACSDSAQGTVRFDSGVGRAARHRLDARRDSDAPVILQGDAIIASDWAAGECLHTRIDLAAAARAEESPLGNGNDAYLVLDPGRWLWRPAQLHPESTIRFELPTGYTVSVPGTPSPNDPARFRLGPTAADWPALTAIGRFEEHRLALAGGVLRVAILPPWTARDLRRIEPVAQALLQTYGRLPRVDVQVLVLPLPGRRDAAPWGELTRGGGSAVHLFVGAEAKPAALIEDWTATHEFAHLLHPYLGTQGRWLGEGLASYYQGVLRARVGALTPADAWERLEAGFQRGESERRSQGLTLEQTALRMGSLRSYMRVYWSGAAFWLEADLALRARGSSLDAVLRGYAECCLAEATRVAPEDFVGALDRIAGADVFAARYRDYAASKSFPDLAPLRERMRQRPQDLAAIMRRLEPVAD